MTTRVKYPRTFHLPWSPGATSDDKVLSTVNSFLGSEVIVTEKLDGENTTIYPDGFVHARSTSGASHPSRTWVRRLAARISHELPSNWRITGENLFARHSISYSGLPSFFLVFGIWETRPEGDFSLAWNEVEDFCEVLGLSAVPVLYKGAFSEKVIRNLWTGTSSFGGPGEGYVIRLAGEVALECFDHSVAKWVRPNHVQTSEDWKSSRIIQNELKPT